VLLILIVMVAFDNLH